MGTTKGSYERSLDFAAQEIDRELAAIVETVLQIRTSIKKNEFVDVADLADQIVNKALKMISQGATTFLVQELYKAKALVMEEDNG